MPKTKTKRIVTELKYLGRNDTARLTADIHGVTANYVRKIARGARNNPDILKTYRKISRQRMALLNKYKQHGRAATKNTRRAKKHGR